MERDSYLEGVRSAWLGELFGEVFFKALADRCENPAMRARWQRLAELENVTGKKMAALLESHGEAAVTDETIEVGDDVLSRYTDTSHRESMMHMKDVIEKAIIHFDQMLAVAPDSDVPAMQFLVQHEQALLTFVEREIAGDNERALEEVDSLLAQPWRGS